MKVAMMQPTFLPWIGYFELIGSVDRFIFLDDFQFVYQSYHQKNRIFVSKNVTNWITVPIDKKRSFMQPINKALIKENTNWRMKLWKCIEANYTKTPYFQEYAEMFRQFLVEPQYGLLKQNVVIIKAISKILGYSCEFLYSSQLACKGKRSGIVKNILDAAEADIYLAAHGSFEYMYQDGVFPLSEVEVFFQNAELQPYLQYGSTKGFIPYLSIIDALFNVGAEATKKLVAGTTKHWLTWAEMVARLEEYKVE